MSTYKTQVNAVVNQNTLLYPFKLHAIIDTTAIATVIVMANNMTEAMTIAKNAIVFTPADNLIPTIMLEGDN